MLLTRKLKNGLSTGVALLAFAAMTPISAVAQSPFIQADARSSMVQGGVDQDSQDVNILFLIDASYSMKEKFGGTDRKMSSAKQVIEQAMTMIPSSVNVGLRVFGQSFSGAPEIDCRQTYMLVPLGQHNRGSLISAVRTVQPAGLTPLEFALRRCAEEDFSRVQGTKTIILISDGKDTCGGNPCEYMRQMSRYGIRIKCDIVGLELRRDKEAREQLNCLAESTGGKYYDASTASDLIESVAHSVKAAISGKVIIKPKVVPVDPPVGANSSQTSPATQSQPSWTSEGSAPTTPGQNALPLTPVTPGSSSPGKVSPVLSPTVPPTRAK